MGVEVLTKKEADRMKKERREGSKKILDMLQASKEIEKKRLENQQKEFDKEDELMDYTKSLIKDDSLRKKINGLIAFNELISKQDIDKYIKNNKLLSTNDSVKSKIKSYIKDIQKNQIENLIKDIKKTKIKPC
jgi:hypothetical protein